MAKIIDPLLVLCWGVLRNRMSDLNSDLLVLCVAVVYEFGGGERMVGCGARCCCL